MDEHKPIIGVGSVRITERSRQYINDVLNAGRLSYGPFMRRLEREFAKIHGCQFGVMSNSGTSALQIALQALKELHGWQDGDEVLVPAVTFVATANIVLHNRMRPVLVDVDPLYYEIDPTKIEAAITPRTRAIIPVHLFGQPADMDPIWEISKRHQLKIIEDSCETMFATYKGKSVGSLSEIGCFSTYVAHLLVTGVGGLNTTNNPDLAVRLHSLMNHGRDSIYISIDDDKNKTVEELQMVIARRFRFVSIGHSFRATEMEAALGLAQLEEWKENIAARRANAQALTKLLSPLQDFLQLPQIRPGCDHSFMMYPLVLKGRDKRELVNFLEERGVGTRDMLPLTNQPVYETLMGWKESDYPVAQTINQSGFYIGCHPDVTEEDVAYMGELFERFFRRASTQPLEGACLILTSCGTRHRLEALLPEIPLEMFDRVVALDSGVDAEASAFLKGRGIELVPGRSETIWDSVNQNPWGLTENHVVLFPADGRHNPREVGRLLLALERGADAAVASRFLPGGARHHPYRTLYYRSIGNRLFTIWANLLFFGNLSDSLSIFRGFKRERLKALPKLGAGWPGVYGLSIQAVRKGWKITEIPTVELISPQLGDRLKILWSLIPLTWVSLREWWRARIKS